MMARETLSKSCQLPMNEVAAIPIPAKAKLKRMAAG